MTFLVVKGPEKKIEVKSAYHTPVLLRESIEALNISGHGTYIDATFGGGGHSRSILNLLNKNGRLFGFDQDSDAIVNVPRDRRFTFVHSNFEYIPHFMRYYKVDEVDGILADLGVSSHHFDVAKRGFSYRYDGALDMRMNRGVNKDVRHVINRYSPEALQILFSKYGEIRNAKTLGRKICETRSKIPIETITDLTSIINQVYRGDRNRYTAQVFQALRMEVNNEMAVLENFLVNAPALLKSGARLVIISYHSVEDQMVKRFFKFNTVDGQMIKDKYGNQQLEIKAINKKPVKAGKEEIRLNRRSSSALMRVAQKV